MWHCGLKRVIGGNKTFSYLYLFITGNKFYDESRIDVVLYAGILSVALVQLCSLAGVYAHIIQTVFSVCNV